MAITKIHAVKTNLKASLDYIMNPQKTDGKMLIDGYGVTPETAYLEFQMTEQIAQLKSSKQQKKEGGNLAYQSSNRLLLMTM